MDDYANNKCLNIQQEDLRLQRNIDNNDKKTDERYQKKMIDDKESDEIYQISKNYKERIMEDIEIMTLQNLSPQKQILGKNLMK